MAVDKMESKLTPIVLARKSILIALSTALSMSCSSIPAYCTVTQSTIMFGEDPGDGAKAMSATPAAKDERIPCMVWTEPNPRMAMLLIHGFGLHKGTYENFAKEMAKDGVAVYAIDVRGFGSWVAKGQNKIDFDGTMKDIGLSLSEMKKIHKGLPIIVLGESMGGAIALKTAATYPDLVNGVISSVPAGDRYDSKNSEIGVLKHLVLHGFNFNSKVDVGNSVVASATKKEELRAAWLNDPLARTKVTPAELIDFKNYMNRSFEIAPKVKNCPVLFIQGTNDKLVRPAGTWKLFNSIGSANRRIVLSKTAEHLIFEESQFSNQDLGFVKKWINDNVAPLPSLAKDKEDKTKVTANQSNDSYRKSSGSATNAASTIDDTDDKKTQSSSTQVATTSTNTSATGTATANKKKAALTYWIELKRKGKVYRCNNKTTFKSGDAIRFHIRPEENGYAYIVLRQGSTGGSAVLFPNKESDSKNYLYHSIDYPLPFDDWLAFDSHPGLEKVRILYSRTHIPLDQMRKQAESKEQVAYISPDTTGAKDLVGTRMQLSWDNPDPVIMPEDIEEGTRMANSSSVRLEIDSMSGAFAVDIALLHQ